MLTPGHIRADVVDIRNPKASPPDDLVTDANVLYWVFYPNFNSLQYAGGKQPSQHQLAEYPKFWKRAAIAKTRFHAVVATMGEFAKVAEYAELEATWLTDSPRPYPPSAGAGASFDP